MTSLLRVTAIALMVLALPGCMLDLLMGAAVQGELAGKAAQSGARAIDKAQDTTGEATLRQSIDAYRAENGYNPSSLAVLIPEYLGSIPVQSNGQPFGYDSTTGRILTGASANGPTAGDQEKMQRLATAINGFGQATGYYPANLDQLAPLYVSEVPKTDGGQSFAYDPNTGRVDFPGGAYGGGAPNVGQRAGGGAGGGSPMTETMTGIGMQQQLNGMNQSGVNAAGTRMRTNARAIGQNQNDKVDNTMNQLGL